MLNLDGATVLVTGGTGSFGNATIDFLKDSGAHFVVFSRDEAKQHDMYTTRKDRNISYIIGDVRDREKLVHAMRGVDYVFHAAALKHVSTGENFPEEVISTNIMGTRNVIEAAETCGVKRLVALSTDKAVYPIGAYGISKAMAEKFVSSHVGNTVNVCLRYGNVLGSRGSVVPLFVDAMRRDETITITNPDMTRFILTLREAVALALKCLADGNDGDLFIMKPPACKISVLVEAMEKHFQKEAKKTIIGIRPGEKMHEVLLTGEEVHRGVVEQENGITYARIAAKHPKDYFYCGDVYDEPEAFSSQSAEQYNADQVLAKLMEANLLCK